MPLVRTGRRLRSAGNCKRIVSWKNALHNDNIVQSDLSLPDKKGYESWENIRHKTIEIQIRTYVLTKKTDHGRRDEQKFDIRSQRR